MTPQLDGVLETSLYVDDPERSARFYETVLGFTAMVRTERLVALDLFGRQVLLLFRKGASADLPDAPHDGSGRIHLAFAIPAAELDRWERWLGQCGVAVEHKRVWERGGSSLYFRDPDGHLLEVATPGVWPRVY